jgi:hypothetical protein
MTHDNPDSRVGALPTGPASKARDPLVWLIALLLFLVALVVLLLLLSRCSGSDDDNAAGKATPTPASGRKTVPDVTVSSSISNGAMAGSGDGEDGRITAGDATLLPLNGSPESSLNASSGQNVTSTSAEVRSVPADEGFRAGSSSRDRIRQSGRSE